MRNIKLLITYDGTDFSGWQRQPDRRTVQQVLEAAIGRLTGVEAPTNASGRTDAGVHALGQVVHFYTTSEHPPAVFVKALNAMLPPDVRVKEAWDVPRPFTRRLTRSPRDIGTSSTTARSPTRSCCGRAGMFTCH